MRAESGEKKRGHVAVNCGYDNSLKRQESACPPIRCPAPLGFPATASRRPRDVHRKGTVSREFKTLPIGSQSVRQRLAVPRVLCRTCRLERQVPLDLAEPKKTSTKCFARYVLQLAQLMTVNDVARHLAVSWELVRGIVGDDLQRRFGRPKLKHLKRIAIDEIYVGKTHKFLTVVLDLDGGWRHPDTRDLKMARYVRQLGRRVSLKELTMVISLCSTTVRYHAYRAVLAGLIEAIEQSPYGWQPIPNADFCSEYCDLSRRNRPCEECGVSDLREIQSHIKKLIKQTLRDTAKQSSEITALNQPACGE
jgi:hypothetical protein